MSHSSPWVSLSVSASAKQPVTLTSAYPAIEEDKQNLLTEPQGAPRQAQLRSRDPCGGRGGISSLRLPPVFQAHLVAGGVAWSVCCAYRNEKSFRSTTVLTVLTPGIRPRDEVLDVCFGGRTLTPG